MPNLPLPCDTALSAESLALLATRPTVAVYRMAAWSPALLPSFMTMTHAMFNRTCLSDELREAVILRVAMHQNSAYEAYHHRPLAELAGLGPEDIEALLTPEPYRGRSSTLRNAIAFTDACMQNTDPSPAAFNEVLRAVGERGVAELGMLIGFYRMVATFVRATGVVLDAMPSIQLVPKQNR